MIINFDINMISSFCSAFIVADLLSPVAEPFLLAVEWNHEMIMSRSPQNRIEARRKAKSSGHTK